VLPPTLPLNVLMALAVDVFVVVVVFVVVSVVVAKCRLLSFWVTVDAEWSYVVLVLVLGPAYALIVKASDSALASKVFFIRCSSLVWVGDEPALGPVPNHSQDRCQAPKSRPKPLIFVGLVVTS
jgi:hypothetical protein